jgi:hypothetical protein
VLLGRILSLEANELLAISKGYYKTQWWYNDQNYDFATFPSVIRHEDFVNGIKPNLGRWWNVEVSWNKRWNI